MAEKVKKFVDKKVMDWKFKKAGEGHSLSEEKIPVAPRSNSGPGTSRPAPSDSSRTAGSAAMARFENKGKHRSQPQRSRDVSREMMRSEVERAQVAAQMMEQQELSEPEPVVMEVSCSSITVHVICVVCQRSVPSNEVLPHLSDCLQEEVMKEPLTGSVQMISTLCEDKEQKQACLDTLTRYLDNIMTHPGEEKYRKIRIRNKAFQDKVASVPGAMMFLEAVGFHQQLLPHQDSEEQFLVLPEEVAEQQELLSVHKELLAASQPLQCKVDRNAQVFRPSNKVEKFNLPDDFFNLSVDDIKREQKLRSEQLEKSNVLRTKVLRERDEVKMAVRHYKFVVIRVRMPDGIILQGIFRPLEKLGDVRMFVSEVLVDQTKTFFFSVLGRSFKDDELTLASLNMVPSAVLNFVWDSSSGPPPSPPYLIPDLLARIQEFG